MKKIAFALIASGVLLSACSNDEDSQNEAAETAETVETAEVEETSEGGLNVDKGLFNVEVTLPEVFFEGEDEETIIASAEENGTGEATVNDDGSVTFKMSKSEHDELMDELKENIEAAKTEIVTSGDYPSIKAIETSNDYSTFTLEVDKEAFENSFDGFATITVGFAGSFYQAFDGTDGEDLHVEIELLDAATGDVYQTIIYPDALDEMGEATE